MHPGGPEFIDLLETPEQEETTTSDALAAELVQLVEQIPAGDAAALRLTVLQGHSIREAAAILGIAPMTASRRRSRAVDAIRYAMGA